MKNTIKSMTYKSTLFYIFYYKQQELTPCKSILYHKEAYVNLFYIIRRAYVNLFYIIRRAYVNLFYIIRRHKTTVVVVVVGIEGGRGVYLHYTASHRFVKLYFLFNRNMLILLFFIFNKN